jgi:hypothetical protein
MSEPPATENSVDELEAYCTFGPERVYVLMAIARDKENRDESSNGAPVIRKIVRDASSLRRKIEELDHAVERFDATYRLYVSANARNTTDACFQLRSRMDEWLKRRLNGDDSVTPTFGRVDSEFKSVLQQATCKDETKFLFDLDDASAAEATALIEGISAHTEVLLRHETPNGYHVVTTPFDHTDLDTDTAYELKTDGMLFVSFLGQ